MSNAAQMIVIFGAGVVVGMVIGIWVTWTAYKDARKEIGQVTGQVTGQLKCGACGSPIIDTPSHVVLTGTEAFRYYRCSQCGTTVTVPLPS